MVPARVQRCEPDESPDFNSCDFSTLRKYYFLFTLISRAIVKLLQQEKNNLSSFLNFDNNKNEVQKIRNDKIIQDNIDFITKLIVRTTEGSF